jgi:hypothetical protein
MRTRMTLGNSLLAAIAVLSLAGAGSAQATSGPGCLRIVNVAANDVLNVRSRPSAAAPVVEALDPEQHGILHLDRDCRPKTAAWSSRWCPITHYNGNAVTHGWVKARFVRDSDCP